LSDVDMGSFTLGEVWASDIEVRAPGRLDVELGLEEELWSRKAGV